LRLKELPTPDLDQIKQEEQERGTGMGGFPTGRPLGDALGRTPRRRTAGRSLRQRMRPLTPVVIASDSEAISGG
jgi:hypothetical protein